MAWVLAYIEPNHELELGNWLSERLHEVFVPCGRFNIKRRRSKKPEEILRPAFPCYGFIKLPLHWETLRRAPGFRYVVKMEGSPVEMSDYSILRIQIMEKEGQFNDLVCAPQITFNVGERAIVIGGPMNGQRGVIGLLPKVYTGRAMLELGNRKVYLPMSSLGKDLSP